MFVLKKNNDGFRWEYMKQDQDICPVHRLPNLTSRSICLVDEAKAVLFGGRTNEKCSSDTYILNLSIPSPSERMKILMRMKTQLRSLDFSERRKYVAEIQELSRICESTDDPAMVSSDEA